MHRPGLERRAITLTSPCTYHIKTTRVVCRRSKTLYHVLSQLFLIHSFSTHFLSFSKLFIFTISLVKLPAPLYSTFYLLFIYFFIYVGAPSIPKLPRKTSFRRFFENPPTYPQKRRAWQHQVKLFSRTEIMNGHSVESCS